MAQREKPSTNTEKQSAGLVAVETLAGARDVETASKSPSTKTHLVVGSALSNDAALYAPHPALAANLEKWELFVCALVLAPVAVLIVRCQMALCARTYFDTLNDYLYGSLPPVFSARVLMRLLIPVAWAAAPSLWLPEDAHQLLQILSACMGLVGCYGFARAYLSKSEALAAALLCALWLLWGMLPMGFSLAYPYDLPALAFSSLGAIAFLRGDFWALVLLVGLGTLNKETMLWLVAAAWAAEFMGPRRLLGQWRAVVLFGVFCLAYVTPRLFMSSVFSKGPLTVSFYEDPVAGITRLETNLRELVTLSHGTWTENFYWWALLYLPACFLWRRFDAKLRSLWVGGGILVAANFVLGNIWEVRIFNEILPLGSTTCLLLLRNCWGRPIDESRAVHSV